MLKSLWNSIKRLFAPPEFTDPKIYITPNWQEAGYQAFINITNPPDDDMSRHRLLEENFREFYRHHLVMCERAKLSPALEKMAFQKFQIGWQQGIQE